MLQNFEKQTLLLIIEKRMGPAKAQHKSFDWLILRSFNTTRIWRWFLGFNIERHLGMIGFFHVER